MVDQANVSAEVCEAFANVTNKTLRWVIAKIEEGGSNVVLEKSGPRESTLEELCAALNDDPCYVVFDFEATREDSSTICKTLFISYSPDSCSSM